MINFFSPRIVRSLITTLVFQIAATSANATTFPLVPDGSVWKYLDDGSNQGVAWWSAAFDDSTWVKSGPAELGYGNGDEATVVDYIDTDPGTSGIQKNETTYFRHSFTVANPKDYTSLSLTLTYDDAGAVYINGNEVARTSNLPSNAAFDTFATSVSSSNSATKTWTLSPSVLTAGLNTIAVEIHQANATSSDISFNLNLQGSDTTSVTRGPYLQSGTPTDVVVRWRTDVPTGSRVLYGTSPTALSQTTTSAPLTTEHEITLSGLTPDTRYYYAIGSPSEVFSGGDEGTFFLTAPVPGTEKATRIWVLGDSGTAGSEQRNVRDRYDAFTGSTHTDLWLMLGDNAYDSGTDSEYQSAVFDIYGPMLRKSVLWPTFGNHDAIAVADNSVNPYFNIFTLPTDGSPGCVPSNTENYYSFDYGNIHFVCLDSQSTNRSVTGAMYLWLMEDLQQTSQKWLIAFWHHPPYTKGSHDSDTSTALVQMRENFLPLLETHGVDLVLGGHSHSYERSRLINGFYATPTLITSGVIKNNGDGKPDGDGAYGKDFGPNKGTVYAVAGSSGKVTVSPLDHPVMISNLNVLGSLILDVNANRLDATFLDDQGTIRDSFSLIKGALAPISVPSSNTSE